MANQDLNTATSRDKFLGIIEKVVEAHTYSAPLVLSNDAIVMQGRNFTVTKTDLAKLQDYKRNDENKFDYAQTEEKTYSLDQEKYWGRFVDKLDERDSNGEVNIDYVVARQSAEVVAPYLDKLRFDAALGNVSQNVSYTEGVEGKAYESTLDVSVILDELGVEKERLLFVTPRFYKEIKKEIVKLPQGDADKAVLGKGYVGQLDNFTVFKVPSKFLPGVQALASAPSVVVSPLQINETKHNDNVPGRFGELVEQLLYTGAFVFDFDRKYIVSIASTKPADKPEAQGVVKERKPAKFVAGKSYKAEDKVTHGGKVYKALKANTGATAPDADSTNWSAV